MIEKEREKKKKKERQMDTLFSRFSALARSFSHLCGYRDTLKEIREKYKIK